jgi:hypothetical protein
MIKNQIERKNKQKETKDAERPGFIGVPASRDMNAARKGGY